MQRLFGKGAPKATATPQNEAKNDADDTDDDADWMKVGESTETLHPSAHPTAHATTATSQQSIEQDVEQPSTDAARAAPRYESMSDFLHEQRDILRANSKELQELRKDLTSNVKQGHAQHASLKAKIDDAERNGKDQTLEASFRFQALRDHSDCQAKELKENTQRSKRWVQALTTRVDDHEALLVAAEEKHHAHHAEITELQAAIRQLQDRQGRLEGEIRSLREPASTSHMRPAVRTRSQESNSAPNQQPDPRRVHWDEDTTPDQQHGQSGAWFPRLRGLMPTRSSERWTLEQHQMHSREGAVFDQCPFCRTGSAGPTDLWMM